MPGTIFGMPFDAEIFVQQWMEAPDKTLTAILDSGAVVKSASLANAVGTGDIYTVPYYAPLVGDAQNYDGSTTIEASEVQGLSQTGCVVGRAKAFLSRDFTADLTGADPQAFMASTVAKYWAKENQKTLLATLKGVFGAVASNGTAKDKEFFAKHVVDTGAIISATDAADACTNALGDNRNAITLAIMHSRIANALEKQNVLEFLRYTDVNGIVRRLNIAQWNGLTVVIDDSVPVEAATEDSAAKYTTYLLGEGSVLTAPAPVEVPAEQHRDPLLNGGQETLITRNRLTFHPNGFSFKKPSSGYTNSATNEQLATRANWGIAFDEKAIAMVALIAKVDKDPETTVEPQSK